MTTAGGKHVMSDSVSATQTWDLASPFRRLLGYFIDMAVVFFLLFLLRNLDYAYLYLHLVAGPKLFEGLRYVLLFSAFGYFLFCDALPNGQSLGKRVCRTAVVGYPYPTNCTLFQSFLRNVPKLLFSVLDGLFALFGLRRRLGDMLAKTIVINT
ncbi:MULTISPECIES: RDD family protein [unclassified Pseudomonas]|uniref:RDD family protein n=1 Tax=unclassified Pseudomonas TaxID=196821 RepID=UPI0021147425|nr:MULTISPECIES: RDD family protein [unclassified Pseudomonas]